MEIGKFVEYKKIFKLYGISEDADKDPHFSLYPENHTVYQQNWPKKNVCMQKQLDGFFIIGFN